MLNGYLIWAIAEQSRHFWLIRLNEMRDYWINLLCGAESDALKVIPCNYMAILGIFGLCEVLEQSQNSTIFPEKYSCPLRNLVEFVRYLELVSTIKRVEPV